MLEHKDPKQKEQHWELHQREGEDSDEYEDWTIWWNIHQTVRYIPAKKMTAQTPFGGRRKGLKQAKSPNKQIRK